MASVQGSILTRLRLFPCYWSTIWPNCDIRLNFAVGADRPYCLHLPAICSSIFFFHKLVFFSYSPSTVELHKGMLPFFFSFLQQWGLICLVWINFIVSGQNWHGIMCLRFSVSTQTRGWPINLCSVSIKVAGSGKQKGRLQCVVRVDIANNACQALHNHIYCGGAAAQKEDTHSIQ